VASWEDSLLSLPGLQRLQCADSREERQSQRISLIRLPYSWVTSIVGRMRYGWREKVSSHALSRRAQTCLLSTLHPCHALDLCALAVDGLLAVFGLRSTGAGLAATPVSAPLCQLRPVAREFSAPPPSARLWGVRSVGCVSTWPTACLRPAPAPLLLPSIPFPRKNIGHCRKSFRQPSSLTFIAAWVLLG
jgi:hypothetical protein